MSVSCTLAMCRYFHSHYRHLFSYLHYTRSCRDISVCGAAEALAAQVTEEHFAKGLLYPPFKDIRKISAYIAASVADKAYDLGEFHFSLNILYLIHGMLYLLPFGNFLSGLATRQPKPENLMKYAESCMYSPAYRSYRWNFYGAISPTPPLVLCCTEYYIVLLYVLICEM